MNTKLAAIIILLSAVYAIYLTLTMYKQNKLSTRLLLMWTAIWLTIGVFAVFPSLLDYLMTVVNMGNRLFFITTGAILIQFIIIFYLTANFSKTNRKIQKLVQEISVLKYKLEEKDSRKE